MPIRPENRDRYPANWPIISRRIRFQRAVGRCECRGECGRPRGHLDTDRRCRNRHGTPAYQTGSPVLLTVAHLDHTPENCQDANLRAMCQGCHLHYDIDHHNQTRRHVAAAELAATMHPLFELPETA